MTKPGIRFQTNALLAAYADAEGLTPDEVRAAAIAEPSPACGNRVHFNGMAVSDCTPAGELLNPEQVELLIAALGLGPAGKIMLDEQSALVAKGFSDEFVNELAGPDGLRPLRARIYWLASRINASNFSASRASQRFAAMRELQELGPLAASAATQLIEFLERSRVERFLVNHGLDAAAQYLGEDRAQRLEAMRTIGAIGAAGRRAEAERALVAYLSDPNAAVRAQAATTLGDLPGHGAFSALLPLLSDPASEVRAAAAVAIGASGATPAVIAAALLRPLEDTDDSVRIQAMAALQTSRVSATPLLLDLVSENLLARDRSWALRKIAAETLEHWGLSSAPAGDALRTALEDPEAEVVAAAALALGAMEYRARGASWELLSLLESHRDPNVLAAAATALGMIGAAPASGPLAEPGAPKESLIVDRISALLHPGAQPLVMEAALRTLVRFDIAQAPNANALLARLTSVLDNPDSGLAAHALRLISRFPPSGEAMASQRATLAFRLLAMTADPLSDAGLIAEALWNALYPAPQERAAFLSEMLSHQDPRIRIASARKTLAFVREERSKPGRRYDDTDPLLSKLLLLCAMESDREVQGTVMTLLRSSKLLGEVTLSALYARASAADDIPLKAAVAILFQEWNIDHGLESNDLKAVLRRAADDRSLPARFRGACVASLATAWQSDGDALIAYLRDTPTPPDSKLRLPAATHLKNLNTPEAHAFLRQLATDCGEATEVRLRALESLHCPDDLPILRAVAFSASESEYLRSRVLRLLVALRDRDSIPLLLDFANQEGLKESVLLETSGALAELEDRRCIPILRKLAASAHEEHVRQSAVRHLVALGDRESLPLLRDAVVRGARVGLCLEAIKGLAQFGDRESLPLLRKLAIAKTEDYLTRESAMEALATLNDRESIPMLKALVRENPNAEAAIFALAAMGERDHIPHLRKLVRYSHVGDYRRKTAISLLGRLGDRESLPLIRSAAINDDEAPALREQAILALPMLFDVGSIPALRLIASNPQESAVVRRAAEDALGALGERSIATGQ